MSNEYHTGATGGDRNPFIGISLRIEKSARIMDKHKGAMLQHFPHFLDKIIAFRKGIVVVKTLEAREGEVKMGHFLIAHNIRRVFIKAHIRSLILR